MDDPYWPGHPPTPRRAASTEPGAPSHEPSDRGWFARCGDPSQLPRCVLPAIHLGLLLIVLVALPIPGGLLLAFLAMVTIIPSAAIGSIIVAARALLGHYRGRVSRAGVVLWCILAALTWGVGVVVLLADAFGTIGAGR